MATGHQERSDSRGGERRGNGEAPVTGGLAAISDELPRRSYFWFWLTFVCHFLQIFVGANMRPLRHMLPGRSQRQLFERGGYREAMSKSIRTERSLARTVGTASRDTRNPSNSTSCAMSVILLLLRH